MTLTDRIRDHASACDRMGAPLYGALMRGMAADRHAGGVVRAVLAGWEDAPANDVVQLRLLGGLHRLVLTGRAPVLEPYYRNLGGSRAPDDVWDVARGVIEDHAAQLRADLAVAPQTNEVGRCAALVEALRAATAATGLNNVRLLEVGASAGLNLRVDHYRIDGPGRPWGPPDAAVVIPGAPMEPDAPSGGGAAAPGSASTGPAPDITIVDRRGCDLHPIDPTTDDGQLRLRSFVWPDHVERFRRLDAALAVAASVPAVVDRSAATPWLRRRLAGPADPGVLTVVWHSVVWQYLTPAEQSEAEEVIVAASARMPLVHAAAELRETAGPSGMELTVTTYDRGAANTRVLGAVPAHGYPVRAAG